MITVLSASEIFTLAMCAENVEQCLSIVVSGTLGTRRIKMSKWHLGDLTESKNGDCFISVFKIPRRLYEDLRLLVDPPKQALFSHVLQESFCRKWFRRVRKKASSRPEGLRLATIKFSDIRTLSVGERKRLLGMYLGRREDLITLYNPPVLEFP